jgi:hypothetical protein
MPNDNEILAAVRWLDAQGDIGILNIDFDVPSDSLVLSWNRFEYETFIGKLIAHYQKQRG